MLVSNRGAAAALSLLASLVLALTFSTPAAPAADLQSQLEAKQSQLGELQERKGVLTTTLSANKRRIESLAAEVAGIREREAVVLTELATKQAQLNTAEAELDSAKERLTSARDHLRRALQALAARLVAIYESGSPDLLSVLVDSADIDEVAARTEYLNSLHSMDEAVAERVRDLRDEVRGIVERRRESKETIESARDEIAAEEAALAGARRELQAGRQDLVAARAKQLAALAQISDNEEELDGSVAEIQAKIAAQLGSGGFPFSSGPVPGATGSMIWPVNGPVVSGFGPRTIEGSFEDHPGIDIAVPEGTAIQAADGGVVAFTQSEAESGGYGNFTCIDHGGGLSSCYAHQSRFAVVPGQSVTQGQVIGYTGCTGYCLGPHLHFEVRVDGVVTDPMGYL